MKTLQRYKIKYSDKQDYIMGTNCVRKKRWLQRKLRAVIYTMYTSKTLDAFEGGRWKKRHQQRTTTS